MTDPFVGHLAFFRVYSGQLKSGSSVYNSTRDSVERIGRLLKMHANKREEIKEVYCGDIAAAVGLKTVSTGDTICDRQNPIVLEAIEFPAPVISVAVEPKTKADQDKLGVGARQADPGGSHLQSSCRPGHRPDDPLRHGRTAPRDSRRPDGARIRGRGQHRQAPGCLSRNHPAAGRSGGQVHPADRRPRPVRARQDRARTAARGRRIRVRQ